MAQVELNITGRVPKYFFGALKEKYRPELNEATQYFRRYLNENDFLNLIFNASLSNSEESKKEIFDVIDPINLRKIPNFNNLIENLISKDLSHFEVMEELFYSPETDMYGSPLGMLFFEEHTKISIVSVFGSHRNTVTPVSSILQEMHLKEFATCEDSYWSESLNDETGYTYFNKIKDLKSKNLFFGFTNDDEFGWYKNSWGSTFLSTDLYFNNLIKFSESHADEYQVTILFDEVVNWFFYIETDNEEFDFKNLTFVNNNKAGEFRGSSKDVIFSHLFYKNEIILPDENYIKSKGISLMYGDERGWETLDFFLNGNV